MASPIASQTKNRIQVSTGNAIISAAHAKMPASGNQGLAGHRKGRGRSGCVLRSASTPPHTSTKAKKVPGCW